MYTQSLRHGEDTSRTSASSSGGICFTSQMVSSDTWKRRSASSRRFCLVVAAIAFYMLISYCLHLQLGRQELAKLSRGFHWESIDRPRALTSKEAFNISMTLVIPCHSGDWSKLPLVIESVSAQTVMPDETIVVLSRSENLPLEPSFDNSTAALRRKVVRTDGTINVSVLGLGHFPRRAEIAAAQVLANTQPLEISIDRIPNFKHFLRDGLFYAGANRVFGAAQAADNAEVISFFDCDDYQHPQRTEFLAKVRHCCTIVLYRLF